MALFKILKRGSGSNKLLEPGFIENENGELVAASNEDIVQLTEGYAYFDQVTGKFYIDIANGDSVKVDVNTTITPDANRICINPTYRILNCGTSDLNYTSSGLDEDSVLAAISADLQDTIEIQEEYIN